MLLTGAQLEQFDRDGFLRFDRLLGPSEVALLKRELDRISAVDSDAIIRERNGALRTVYRAHEPDGPTFSPVYRRLMRSPRMLEPVRQVLRDDDVYIYHAKANIKAAIDGTVWLWHQDYGYWQHDGVPTSNMATFLVMLDVATELSGCLYFLPGSHKLPVQPAIKDETTTSYPQWTVRKDVMRDVLAGAPPPVAIVGGPGTCVLFHCNLLHASGHNLAAHDRWHFYAAYNTCANRPNPIPANPRPDYVVSRNCAPLPLESDDLDVSETAPV